MRKRLEYAKVVKLEHKTKCADDILHLENTFRRHINLCHLCINDKYLS